MSSKRKEVRILLTGEHGVGKTSLIMALVSEEFPDDVPARAEEITIPADVTPERVPTQIVDSSAIDQTEEQILEEIERADVICLCYSADDEDSISKISSYWLPLVRQHLGADHRTPIILVGNKCDLFEQSTMEMVLPIMNRYGEVETVVECSAKTLKNITELFYYAQKAVLHPTAPLYIADTRDLTEECKAALERIFTICDLDGDDILSDNELNRFQKYCFNTPLQPSALQDVKDVVQKFTDDGVRNDGLTKKGFLYLHLLFIQRGRHETTWTVLRYFGYDNNLQLLHDYIIPPKLRVAPRCTTELTKDSVAFISALFNKYDKDDDECLSPVELQCLFSTCPALRWGSELSNNVQTNAQGWLTREGFMAQWSYLTYTDVPRTMETLAYLGYTYQYEDMCSAVTVTLDKRLDIERAVSSRSVFQCFVFGATGVGKTNLLQGLLGRSAHYVATMSSDHLPVCTVAGLTVLDQHKTLILREVGESAEWFTSPVDQRCDVACLLYDVTRPETFAYCTRVYKEYFSSSDIPVLLVAGRCDLPAVAPPSAALDPVEFCRTEQLLSPVPFSAHDPRASADLYLKLTALAAFPRGASMSSNTGSQLIKIALGLSIAAGLGLVLFKYLKR